MRKISILIILLLIVTLISMTSCEEKKTPTPVITNEEKDDYVPQQAPEEEPPVTEQEYPETQEVAAADILGLELTKKSDETWIGISLLEDKLEGEDIMSFSGVLDYERSLYEVEAEKLVDGMICDFKASTGEISCASPFPLSKGKVLNFRMKLRYVPDGKSDSKVAFELTKVNAKKVSIEVNKEYSLGCSVGSDCEKGMICIDGLCGGDCSTNMGVECMFNENGVNKKGICAYADVNEAVCDTEEAVKSEIGSSLRGYWGSCTAPPVLSERNSDMYDPEKQIFNDQICDPDSLEDGFNGTGICVSGECLINLPDLTIKKVTIEPDKSSYVVAKVILFNNGIKDIKLDNEINFIEFDICRDKACTKPVISYDKETELVMSAGNSKLVEFETRHILSDVESYKIKVDPHNLIEELDEENNVEWVAPII